MGFALYTHTNYMKLVKGGPLVTTIVNQMLQFKSGNSSRSVYIYSGHDLTLVSVLRLLDLINETSSLPKYGATLAFELHNGFADDNSQLEVRVCTNLIFSYHSMHNLFDNFVSPNRSSTTPILASRSRNSCRFQTVQRRVCSINSSNRLTSFSILIMQMLAIWTMLVTGRSTVTIEPRIA